LLLPINAAMTRVVLFNRININKESK